jgi:ectoine hydroxylase-related dioxygenase (phytanoyl-CoA dioxygenase family)
MELALRNNGYLDERSFQNPVILHSLAGCSQQQWHLDFKPNSTSGIKPMSALLALEANTRFETQTQTLELDVGDLLVFDGDLVHAGAAYRDDNTRLHAYLYPLGSRRVSNQTFLVL